MKGTKWPTLPQKASTKRYEIGLFETESMRQKKKNRVRGKLILSEFRDCCN